VPTQYTVGDAPGEEEGLSSDDDGDDTSSPSLIKQNSAKLSTFDDDAESPLTADECVRPAEGEEKANADWRSPISNSVATNVAAADEVVLVILRPSEFTRLRKSLIRLQKKTEHLQSMSGRT